MFLTALEVRSAGKFWVLTSPLVYKSARHGTFIVPTGFRTDFASVPRIPFIYALFGNRSHSAAALHDFLYSKDSPVSRRVADAVFKEAMESRGQSKCVCFTMWTAVRLFGWTHYKRMEEKNADKSGS